MDKIKNKKNYISACIVAHNEEHQIERCLKSIYGVVDEIIIIHDGPCSDNTLKIAKKYTSKIFIGEKLGNPEPHRVTIFNKAKGNWILVIDPDEYLSKELRANLRKLVNSKKADGYFFLWRFWDGKKYITKNWPYRIGVVRKDKLRFLAILHPQWTVDGKVINVDYQLEHRPNYNNTSMGSFRTKWMKWLRIHAHQILVPINELPNFQFQSDSLPRHLVWIRDYSLFAAPFVFFYFLFGGFILSPINEWKNLYKFFLLQALYYFLLSLKVFQLKYLTNSKLEENSNLKIDNKISACLVIFNEEKLIERCLKSIRPIVDDIVVIHDGPCKDKSIEICKKYGARVYIRPHIGEAEPHRALAYKLARHKWILQLDADEYFLKDAQKKIPNLTQNVKIACYMFLWPVWDGKKYITSSWPYRKVLFRKDRIKYLGFPHEEVRVKGMVKKLPIRMEHKPEYNNLNIETFNTKWRKWLNYHAEFLLMDLSKFSTYPENSKLKPHYYFITKQPLLCAFPIFIYHFTVTIISGGWREGLNGIRTGFYTSSYYFLLCIKIYQLGNKVNPGNSGYTTPSIKVGAKA